MSARNLNFNIFSNIRLCVFDPTTKKPTRRQVFRIIMPRYVTVNSHIHDMSMGSITHNGYYKKFVLIVCVSELITTVNNADFIKLKTHLQKKASKCQLKSTQIHCQLLLVITRSSKTESTNRMPLMGR